MGILAKEIEHKLTQILLDARREFLMNGKSLKSENGMIKDAYNVLAELNTHVEMNDEPNQKRASTKLIALLIQYQLKYL